MLKAILTLLITLFAIEMYSQTPNPAYDSTLAKSLGGNDNGMKTFVLSILKTGTNKTTDKKELDSLFAGHMNNINRLAKEKKLFVAGPLRKNDKTYRGIFIFDVDNIEAAEKLVASDPAVKAGIFEVEHFIWFGSAAMGEINNLHNRITKFVE